jgi:hypothetical protein
MTDIYSPQELPRNLQEIQKITPPSTVLSEHLPNGGLLMSATTETFDIDNPAHLKAAQDMAAAMAPLNALPWPSPRASSDVC